MYNNGSLAPVIQQRSEHSCLVHVAFHIPKDCLHFSLFLFLSSFFLCSQHSSSFWFSFYCRLSHFTVSRLIVFSALSALSHGLLSCCHPSLTSPPGWLPCPDLFSSSASQAASPSAASGAASVYTLMMRLPTGTSPKSLEKASKRAGSAWWPGLTTILHVIIW